MGERKGEWKKSKKKKKAFEVFLEPLPTFF